MVYCRKTTPELHNAFVYLRRTQRKILRGLGVIGILQCRELLVFSRSRSFTITVDAGGVKSRYREGRAHCCGEYLPPGAPAPNLTEQAYLIFLPRLRGGEIGELFATAETACVTKRTPYPPEQLFPMPLAASVRRGGAVPHPFPIRLWKRGRGVAPPLRVDRGMTVL